MRAAWAIAGKDLLLLVRDRMALFWALVLKLAIGGPEHAYSEALKEMARVGISINGVLMIL